MSGEVAGCLADGCSEHAPEPPLCARHSKLLGRARARQLRALLLESTQSDRARARYWAGLAEARAIISDAAGVRHSAPRVAVQVVLPGFAPYGARPYQMPLERTESHGERG